MRIFRPRSSYVVCGEDVYFVGQNGNAKLLRSALPLMDQAKALYADSGTTTRLYHCWDYQAKTWACPQRIICKAEVTPQGDNIRFVVTNLKRAQPSFIYKTAYCARGRMENFIKNHKTFLHSDHLLSHLPGQSLPSLSPQRRLCPDARLGTNRVARHEVDQRTVQYPAKSSLESRRARL